MTGISSDKRCVCKIYPGACEDSCMAPNSKRSRVSWGPQFRTADTANPKVGHERRDIAQVGLSAPTDLKAESKPLVVSHDKVNDPKERKIRGKLEMRPPKAISKAVLLRLGANGSSQSIQIDILNRPGSSFESQPIGRKYSPSNSPKEIPVFQQLPGRLDPVSPSKYEVLPNDKDDVERKLLVEMIQSDKEPRGEEFLDDGNARMLEGYILKDILHVSKAENRNKFKPVLAVTASACERKLEEQKEIEGSPKIERSDFVPLCGDRVTAKKQGERVSNSALPEATRGLKAQKNEIIVTGRSKYPFSKKAVTSASEQNFEEGKSFISGEKAGNENMVGIFDDGGKQNVYTASMVSNDSSIVPCNDYEAAVSRSKVRELLNLYKDTLRKWQENKAKPERKGKASFKIYMDAAKHLEKEQKWVNVDKIVGAVPGVHIGDHFQFRAELVIIGLHHESFKGIDYMKKDGKTFAISIVASDRYANEAESPDILIYSGEGGNRQIVNKKPKDQKLLRGNLALKNSMEARLPIRVVRGCVTLKASKTMDENFRKKSKLIYDGLYIVNKFWQERGQYGKLVFKFLLNRIPGQLKLPWHDTVNWSRKSAVPYASILLNDISQGKENKPIRVVNVVDFGKPPPFDYITKMMYPKLYEFSMATGCNCLEGCSDYKLCSCVFKNSGFNNGKSITERKHIVYECGPCCKCPPLCKNRVSQHGIRFQLEVFKTNSKGWGVRSRNYISSGSFICEYLGELLQYKQGELLQYKQADERVGFDESVFDSANYSNLQFSLKDDDGFGNNEVHFGNVGRFIKHSCSPNMYAQNVLFDHEDERRPHVMLFAAKNIPPLQELTFDHKNVLFDHVDKKRPHDAS